MASILLTPFVLYFSLPYCTEAILEFVRDHTVFVEGVGDICSLANFDFEKHGNSKYGAVTHCPKVINSVELSSSVQVEMFVSQGLRRGAKWTMPIRKNKECAKCASASVLKSSPRSCWQFEWWSCSLFTLRTSLCI